MRVILFFACTVVGLACLMPTTAHAAAVATFNMSISPSTITLGQTYTVTFSVTPADGQTISRASQSVLNYAPWNQLVSIDNSGSAFDTTLTEGLQPGGDGTSCLTLDRSSTKGVSAPTVLARVTFRALKAGTLYINQLDSACSSYRGAWLPNGYGVGSLLNFDSLQFNVVDPSAAVSSSSSGGSVTPAATQSSTTATSSPAAVSPASVSQDAKDIPATSQANPSSAVTSALAPNAQSADLSTLPTSSLKATDLGIHTAIVSHARFTHVTLLAYAATGFLGFGSILVCISKRKAFARISVHLTSWYTKKPPS